jgi:alpha-tubulin suppressor-like RCC1 family protein
MLDFLGYVYASGCSDSGQLGVISYNFMPKICKIPYVIMPGFLMSNPAKKIQAGDGFTLILSEQGHVYSCGKGNFGRLG